MSGEDHKFRDHFARPDAAWTSLIDLGNPAGSMSALRLNISSIDLEPHARENQLWIWGSFEVRRQTSIESAPNQFSEKIGK